MGIDTSSAKLFYVQSLHSISESSLFSFKMTNPTFDNLMNLTFQNDNSKLEADMIVKESTEIFLLEAATHIPSFLPN
jgi:hypothetical protein